MKCHNLLKTNLLVCGIMLLGFFMAIFLSQNANYRGSLANIEEITSLSMDGIYYQLSLLLRKPVDVGLTMSHDTLLIQLLKKERESLEDENYTETIKNYLEAYHDAYNFDSVFLVSADTRRYYNYDGFDRIVSQDNKAEAWYFDFLASGKEYSVNVDTDRTAAAQNAITVFVNCRIEDSSGKVMGVVGIGINAEALKSIIRGYEKSYNVQAAFVDPEGIVQISDNYTGVQKQNLFNLYNIANLKSQLFPQDNPEDNRNIWTTEDKNNDEWYFASRYVPVLSWYLIIGHNTADLVKKLKSETLKSMALLAVVIICVLLIISALIRKFNHNIVQIVEQRQKLFKEATETLYEDIFEWDLSNEAPVGKNTKEYLAGIGAGSLSYNDALNIIAEKQIKPEFRNGYLAVFNSKNALDQFAKGRDHLSYEFQISTDSHAYRWMRIDAHIFYSPENKSAHMFTYRKDITVEKQKELLANVDEMTHCYTKKATERLIDKTLMENPRNHYAFFIFDLDNFKHANDSFGHAFGDLCIKSFAAAIKKSFRENDIVGRLGGDEFGAFIPFPSDEWLRTKCEEIWRNLNFVCSTDNASWKISASIGISQSPIDGETFAELYKKADNALYEVKQHGKNGFALASPACRTA